MDTETLVKLGRPVYCIEGHLGKLKDSKSTRARCFYAGADVGYIGLKFKV